MPSYKADNRPCAVEHLVQTLGEKIRDKWNKVCNDYHWNEKGSVIE